MAYHDNLHSMGRVSSAWLFYHGRCGVDLFFAISGVLICWRLLDEEKAFGHISLRNFYIRRAFRILPPVFAYLAAIGILSLAGILSVTFRELFFSGFFLRNYSTLVGNHTGDWYFTGHLWSLSLEEHFYLILPALLVLTRRRWRIPALLGLCLLIEINRMRVMESRPWEHVQFHTDIRLDALLFPAIFAVLVQSPQIKERMMKWLRFWPLLLIPIIVLETYWEGHSWEMTLFALLMPLLVLGSVLNPYGYLAMVLEWAPLRYIGRISYSLYLWQELFLVGHYYGKFPLGVLQDTPLRYLAAFSFAAGSYHLLERPLIKLGHRLAPPATPGRGDLQDDPPGVEVLLEPAAPSGGPKS
jgi:peptidoglycan/LPS O-acetylase OafA/YrhL